MDASGMPVMPTTVPPRATFIRDSAFVENRGPWITTRVPPSTGRTAASPAPRIAARPRGQYGSAKPMCTTAPTSP